MQLQSGEDVSMNYNLVKRLGVSRVNKILIALYLSLLVSFSLNQYIAYPSPYAAWPFIVCVIVYVIFGIILLGTKRPCGHMSIWKGKWGTVTFLINRTCPICGNRITW